MKTLARVPWKDGYYHVHQALRKVAIDEKLTEEELTEEIDGAIVANRRDGHLEILHVQVEGPAQLMSVLEEVSDPVAVLCYFFFEPDRWLTFYTALGVVRMERAFKDRKPIEWKELGSRAISAFFQGDKELSYDFYLLQQYLSSPAPLPEPSLN